MLEGVETVPCVELVVGTSSTSRQRWTTDPIMSKYQLETKGNNPCLSWMALLQGPLQDRTAMVTTHLVGPQMVATVIVEVSIVVSYQAERFSEKNESSLACPHPPFSYEV